MTKFVFEKDQCGCKLSRISPSCFLAFGHLGCLFPVSSWGVQLPKVDVLPQLFGFIETRIGHGCRLSQAIPSLKPLSHTCLGAF